MEKLSMDKIAFYTSGDGYVFINKDLEESGLGFSFAGDFVVTLANYDTWLFKFLLTCSTIAFANNELSIIKNAKDIDSITEYFQSKAEDITEITDQMKTLNVNKEKVFLESILRHYMFQALDVNEIIKFIYEDFFELYSRWELPVTAKVLLWECILALMEFKKETPKIGIMEITELCQNQIEEYKSMAQSIIENNYAIVNNLKQDISVNIKYYPKVKKALSIYYLYNLESMLAFDAIFLQENNIIVKKCANCGLFFVPEKRSDEIYCSNIYENGRTCKQIGYENKIKKDDFKSAYRKAYKTQRARIKYNSHIKNYEEIHFKPWEQAAKKALSDFTTKNDIEGFKKWLMNNKDSF
jgi:hypothetical protein